ncbi:MAG: hypothetical protein QM811_15300 [Pirellulales bacterium]
MRRDGGQHYEEYFHHDPASSPQAKLFKLREFLVDVLKVGPLPGLPVSRRPASKLPRFTRLALWRVPPS